VRSLTQQPPDSAAQNGCISQPHKTRRISPLSLCASTVRTNLWGHATTGDDSISGHDLAGCEKLFSTYEMLTDWQVSDHNDTPCRRLKKAVQRGRSERSGAAHFSWCVEALSDARTKLANFFSILLGDQGRTAPSWSCADGARARLAWQLPGTPPALPDAPDGTRRIVMNHVG
jgi:hypothetical protein